MPGCIPTPLVYWRSNASGAKEKAGDISADRLFGVWLPAVDIYRTPCIYPPHEVGADFEYIREFAVTDVQYSTSDVETATRRSLPL